MKKKELRKQLIEALHDNDVLLARLNELIKVPELYEKLTKVEKMLTVFINARDTPVVIKGGEEKKKEINVHEQIEYWLDAYAAYMAADDIDFLEATRLIVTDMVNHYNGLI